MPYLVYVHYVLLTLNFLDFGFSEHAEKFGYGVVDRFVGHGIGTVFHSEPLIFHHRKSFSFLIGLFATALLFIQLITETYGRVLLD